MNRNATLHTTSSDHTTTSRSSAFKPSRRKRWAQKIALGSMMVLAGAGAQQAGLLSPEKTVQLAALPSDASLVLTPAEADAEAREAPSVVPDASDFSPTAYSDRVGTLHQTGEASYYGNEFAGRPTANGETFDPNAMTAAHRTLPLGTVVRVTNTANGESVVLRVNDRGPYAKDRVLDVSHAAARVLDMEHAGTAHVRVEVL